MDHTGNISTGLINHNPARLADIKLILKLHGENPHLARAGEFISTCVDAIGSPSLSRSSTVSGTG